jgi:hypothetical protein
MWASQEKYLAWKLPLQPALVDCQPKHMLSVSRGTNPRPWLTVLFGRELLVGIRSGYLTTVLDFEAELCFENWGARFSWRESG